MLLYPSDSSRHLKNEEKSRLVHNRRRLVRRKGNGTRVIIISNPEGNLAANQLCFREEPFELIDFAVLAEKIYGPFLNASGSGEGNEV